jgi:predicted lipoprotein with Yx(FWY)xxD motif
MAKSPRTKLSGLRLKILTYCLFVLLVVGVVGCGGGNDTITEEAAKEPSARTTTSEAPHKPKKGSWGAVFGAENEHGIMLFDLSGHTLYRFDADKGSVPSCYGACAKSWPPALTEGKIRAVDVPRKLVGTTKRKDGTIQLTYDGHPLYTHSGERQGKSDATGVTAFGAKWYALRRNGEDIPS